MSQTRLVSAAAMVVKSCLCQDPLRWKESPNMSQSSTLDQEAIDRFGRQVPVDDEPETPEERASVEQALRELREGRISSHEEVKRRLDLS